MLRDNDPLGKMIKITNRFIFGFELIALAILIWIFYGAIQNTF
jgi:hypothetical protein